MSFPPLLTSRQVRLILLRPHLHLHIQPEVGSLLTAMPAALCSRSKRCELHGKPYSGLYHSRKARTTIKLVQRGREVWSPPPTYNRGFLRRRVSNGRSSIKWERETGNPRRMNEPRLSIQLYGRPGVAIPEGVVPAGKGLPKDPFKGANAPVPGAIV